VDAILDPRICLAEHVRRLVRALTGRPGAPLKGLDRLHEYELKLLAEALEASAQYRPDRDW
jgi:hypothetical protein